MPEIWPANDHFRISFCRAQPKGPFRTKNSMRSEFTSHLLSEEFQETPTLTGLGKSTAVHLQFVRQYAPHLYRCTFLASKPWRQGSPTVQLPFALQYASNLYGNTFVQNRESANRALVIVL